MNLQNTLLITDGTISTNCLDMQLIGATAQMLKSYTVE